VVRRFLAALDRRRAAAEADPDGGVRTIAPQYKVNPARRQRGAPRTGAMRIGLAFTRNFAADVVYSGFILFVAAPDGPKPTP
jgi:hypothetical protein